MPLDSAFASMGIGLSAMLFGFGFRGFRQTAVFSNIDIQQAQASPQNKDDNNTPYSKSGLSEAKKKALADILSGHMTTVKPYLNEDLNLNLLADQADIKSAHLSQIINQQFNMNFYDYINQYRIEEVKSRLRAGDMEHLTILGLAYECGFKSKSSFNRYFKKYTGMSPTAFKKFNSCVNKGQPLG